MEPSSAATSVPLISFLPGMLQEDDFVQRFCGGLDEVLEPVFSVLDSFPAYLDPHTGPREFVAWLGSWLCVAVDDTWPDERVREVVAEAGHAFSRRGTAQGLIDQLAIVVDGEWELDDNGGATWSTSPDGELPGSDDPAMRVRLRVDDPGAVDVERLDAIIARSKPAHLHHQLEITASRG